ncbi:MAG: hypothetical protein HON94_16570 [Methylococcales bacterium]|jgi:flagellin-specific chaperone FliS|nr:hypothetical protein [Methylococcales bacterium]MBT7411034.1 hypothetical protein [Methylococcales bacterium]
MYQYQQTQEQNENLYRIFIDTAVLKVNQAKICHEKNHTDKESFLLNNTVTIVSCLRDSLNIKDAQLTEQIKQLYIDVEQALYFSIQKKSINLLGYIINTLIKIQRLLK